MKRAQRWPSRPIRGPARCRGVRARRKGS